MTRFTLTDRRGRHHNDLAIVTEGPTSEALVLMVCWEWALCGSSAIVDMPERMLYISR